MQDVRDTCAYQNFLNMTHVYTKSVYIRIFSHMHEYFKIFLIQYETHSYTKKHVYMRIFSYII